MMPSRNVQLLVNDTTERRNGHSASSDSADFDRQDSIDFLCSPSVTATEVSSSSTWFAISCSDFSSSSATSATYFSADSNYCDLLEESIVEMNPKEIASGLQNKFCKASNERRVVQGSKESVPGFKQHENKVTDQATKHSMKLADSQREVSGGMITNTSINYMAEGLLKVAARCNMSCIDFPTPTDFVAPYNTTETNNEQKKEKRSEENQHQGKEKDHQVVAWKPEYNQTHVSLPQLGSLANSGSNNSLQRDEDELDHSSVPRIIHNMHHQRFISMISISSFTDEFIEDSSYSNFNNGSPWDGDIDQSQLPPARPQRRGSLSFASLGEDGMHLFNDYGSNSDLNHRVEEMHREASVQLNAPPRRPERRTSLTTSLQDSFSANNEVCIGGENDENSMFAVFLKANQNSPPSRHQRRTSVTFSIPESLADEGNKGSMHYKYTRAEANSTPLQDKRRIFLDKSTEISLEKPCISAIEGEEDEKNSMLFAFLKANKRAPPTRHTRRTSLTISVPESLSGQASEFPMNCVAFPVDPNSKPSQHQSRPSIDMGMQASAGNGITVGQDDDKHILSVFLKDSQSVPPAWHERRKSFTFNIAESFADGKSKSPIDSLLCSVEPKLPPLGSKRHFFLDTYSDRYSDKVLGDSSGASFAVHDEEHCMLSLSPKHNQSSPLVRPERRSSLAVSTGESLADEASKPPMYSEMIRKLPNSPPFQPRRQLSMDIYTDVILAQPSGDNIYDAKPEKGFDTFLTANQSAPPSRPERRASLIFSIEESLPCEDTQVQKYSSVLPVKPNSPPFQEEGRFSCDRCSDSSLVKTSVEILENEEEDDEICIPCASPKTKQDSHLPNLSDHYHHRSQH